MLLSKATCFIFLFIVFFTAATTLPNYAAYVYTFAGREHHNIGDGEDAYFAKVFPNSIALDSKAELLYIADPFYHCVRVMDLKSKLIATLAGNGEAGYSGDGAYALYAQLNKPTGVAVDAERNVVYIVDSENSRIRVVNRITNIISTFAGNGKREYSGDGKLATEASFVTPYGIAVNNVHNLVYIVDNGNHRVRVVYPNTNIISTFAGTGVPDYNGDGILATEAQIRFPSNVAIDHTNNLVYISTNTRIRVVNMTTSIIETFAGNGIRASKLEDGLATNVSLAAANGICVDEQNNLVFIADMLNQRIAIVNRTTGLLSTFAGGREDLSFSGESGTAKNVSLNEPSSVTLDVAKNMVYIADTYNYRIRQVNTATNMMSTIVGSPFRENVLASDVSMEAVTVAVDSMNNMVYIADGETMQVRVVNRLTNIVTNFAGNGKEGYTGDGGLAVDASFNFPFGIVVDELKNLVYISDAIAHKVRVVNRATGIISKFAGTGKAEFNGDNMLAQNSSLNVPHGMVIDYARNMLYIADSQNHRIRAVNLQTNTISTVAGNGVAGYSGDGSIAVLARLNAPFAIDLDHLNSLLYIADTSNNVIRVVNLLTNIISTFAGNGRTTYNGDGMLATNASLSKPYGVAVDVIKNVVYISDSLHARIRVVDRATSMITTFAGTGVSSFGGDGGLVSSALFNHPQALHLDMDFSLLYVIDRLNKRVRVIGGSRCNFGSLGTEYDCNYCSAGYYANQLGLKSCSACPASSYLSTTGASSELMCQSCPMGTFSAQKAAVSISTCRACPMGTYAKASGITTLNDCAPCNVGYYSNTLAANSSAVCQPCDIGTFSSVLIANSSSTCTSCDFGYTTVLPGTPSSDYCVRDFRLPLIVGTLVGTLLVIIMLTLLICFVVQYQRAKSSKMNQVQSLKQVLLNKNDSEHQELPLSFDMSMFQIQFEELTNLQELASGGGGAMVLKAKWKNQWVVCKLMKIDTICNNKGAESFVNELKLCTSIRGKNIVFFFGACLSMPRIGIVTEYCSNGTLKQYLCRNQVSWKKKFELTIEIAQGLAFLHSCNVIHRDMKCDNVLIDDDGHVKITDFGVSTIKHQQEYTRYVGTSHYISPEVVLGKPYDEKCDIFALGIIMFEILTENFYPFGKSNAAVELHVANDPTMRPRVPTEVEKQDASRMYYCNLMRQCWEHESTARPSAAQVAEQLLNNYELLYHV